LKLISYLFLAIWFAFGHSAYAHEPLPTVPNIELERYAGRWYEVARLPNRFERDCASDITAAYALRPDQKIDVLNQCRQSDGSFKSARGIARSADGQSTSRLKVRFAPAWLGVFPFVWGDYWIIDLADDYGWSMVGSPDRQYLWLLSRQPELDDAQMAKLLKKAKVLGFDTEKIVYLKNGTRETARIPRVQ
jgi:apolipoprotein D and lipocalin family protein